MATNLFGNINRRIALAMLVDLLNDSPAWHRGDPRMYGAAGDGTTDDTAALQAAIDAGELYLPVGLTFYVTSLAVGPTTYSSTAQNAPFRVSGGGTLLQVPSTASPVLVIEDCENVVVEDITIDGNRDLRVSGNQDGLQIIDSSRVQVRGVTTRRCSGSGVNAFVDDGTLADVVLSHVTARDNTLYGITIESATRPVIEECLVRDNTLDGIKISTSIDPVLRGGEVTANGQTGIVTNASRALTFTGGLKVHGNALAGISIADTNGYHIFGNVKVWGNGTASAGTYQGILVVGSPRCTFIGNVCASPTTVTETQAHGIYLNDCPNAVLVGNILAGVTQGLGTAGTTAATIRAAANYGQVDI